MHYNTGRVGRILNGHHYRPLVEAIPNLVATKTMTGDLGTVASVVRDAPELMHFLTETSIGHGGLFGQVGLLGTFGALAPKKCWAVFRAANDGRAREAARSPPGSTVSGARSSTRSWPTGGSTAPTTS